MEARRDGFAFRDVVVVADIFDASAASGTYHQRRDLEMTDVRTLDSLRSCLFDLGLRVHHYRSPRSLARNAWRHHADIVLSIYGGQRSRNRMALVPAVCETFGLRFIGPDTYGRIIAQDKEVSKRLATDCGLRTPSWRIVRSLRDLERSRSIQLPVVVKPLYEGTSIGISQKSRATSHDDAALIARELLGLYEQPVLIEEFVAGREVAYSRIQGADDAAWAFSEIVIPGDAAYFENRLFDAYEKQEPRAGRTVRNIDPELGADDRTALEYLLAAFGRYGYCRVDGRFSAGRFWFLELTPDAWIAPTGQFVMGFTEKGWTYASVIGAVLASAS